MAANKSFRAHHSSAELRISAATSSFSFRRMLNWWKYTFFFCCESQANNSRRCWRGYSDVNLHRMKFVSTEMEEQVIRNACFSSIDSMPQERHCKNGWSWWRCVCRTKINIHETWAIFSVIKIYRICRQFACSSIKIFINSDSFLESPTFILFLSSVINWHSLAYPCRVCRRLLYIEFISKRFSLFSIG